VTPSKGGLGRVGHRVAERVGGSRRRLDHSPDKHHQQQWLDNHNVRKACVDHGRTAHGRLLASERTASVVPCEAPLAALAGACKGPQQQLDRDGHTRRADHCRAGRVRKVEAAPRYRRRPASAVMGLADGAPLWLLPIPARPGVAMRLSTVNLTARWAIAAGKLNTCRACRPTVGGTWSPPTCDVRAAGREAERRTPTLPPPRASDTRSHAHIGSRASAIGRGPRTCRFRSGAVRLDHPGPTWPPPITLTHLSLTIPSRPVQQ